jgi:hypothetical protein
MQTTDSICPTVRTVPARASTTCATSGPTPCARVHSSVPRRRSTRAFSAGQLACEEYARAAVDARNTGVWL